MDIVIHFITNSAKRQNSAVRISSKLIGSSIRWNGEMHCHSFYNAIIAVLRGGVKKKNLYFWVVATRKWRPPPLPQLWSKYKFFLSKFFFMPTIPWNEKKIDQTWKWNFYPPPPPNLNYAKFFHLMKATKREWTHVWVGGGGLGESRHQERISPSPLFPSSFFT